MKNQPASIDEIYRTHATVSPEEILAAGGATAFGLRNGKTSDALKIALKNAPKPEPFTDKEWLKTVEQLDNDK